MCVCVCVCESERETLTLKQSVTSFCFFVYFEHIFGATGLLTIASLFTTSFFCYFKVQTFHIIMFEANLPENNEKKEHLSSPTTNINMAVEI